MTAALDRLLIRCFCMFSNRPVALRVNMEVLHRPGRIIILEAFHNDSFFKNKVSLSFPNVQTYIRSKVLTPVCFFVSFLFGSNLEEFVVVPREICFVEKTGLQVTPICISAVS